MAHFNSLIIIASPFVFAILCYLAATITAMIKKAKTPQCKQFRKYYRENSHGPIQFLFKHECPPPACPRGHKAGAWTFRR